MYRLLLSGNSVSTAELRKESQQCFVGCLVALSSSHTKCCLPNGNHPELPDENSRCRSRRQRQHAPFRTRGSESAIHSSQSVLGPFATNYYNKSNAVQPTPGHIPARPHKDLPTRRPKDQDARLRYIWIDSLCNIQDCPTDWQHEASQMATIYPMDQPVWCAGLQSRDKHDS